MPQGASGSSTIDGQFRRVVLEEGGNVPASSTASGKKGEIAFAQGYVYYCYSDNHWVRAALSAF